VEDVPKGFDDKPGTQNQQNSAKKKERSFPEKQPGKQMVRNPDRIGEDGATALDQKLQRATPGGETGGKNSPRFFGGIGKAREPIGRAGPEGGGEKKIAGFGGRPNLSGQPVESGEGLDAADEFAEGVVIKATGQGEKRKQGGLERFQRPVLVGRIGDGFYFAGKGGRKSGGVEQVSGKKGDGLKRLAAGLVGGKEGREGLEVEGLENGLHPRGGIGLQDLAEAEADGLAKQEGEDFRRSGDIFFEGQAGGGQNLFQTRVAGAEPGEVAAGRKDRAGAGDGFRAAGEVHGLGKEGEAKAGAKVFGVEEGGGQFRQGGRAFAGSQQHPLFQRMETDGQKQCNRQRDGAGDREGPEGGFQE
jgi:hypothetical protein